MAFKWKQRQETGTFFVAAAAPPCFPRKINWEQKAKRNEMQKDVYCIVPVIHIPSAQGIRPHTVPIETAVGLNSRRMCVWNLQTTRVRSRRRQAIWTR